MANLIRGLNFLLIFTILPGCGDYFPYLLTRIKAEPGELVDRFNQPKATLSACPEGAKFESNFEIRGFVNWPKDYKKPEPCPYGDGSRIVANGIIYKKTVIAGFGSQPGGLRLIGDFLLDPCLNPIGDFIWDGKKNGAIHTLKGKVQFYRYEFDSEAEDPLVFQVTPSGYKYLKGKGTVKDLETGNTATLGK